MKKRFLFIILMLMMLYVSVAGYALNAGVYEPADNSIKINSISWELRDEVRGLYDVKVLCELDADAIERNEVGVTMLTYTNRNGNVNASSTGFDSYNDDTMHIVGIDMLDRYSGQNTVEFSFGLTTNEEEKDSAYFIKAGRPILVLVGGDGLNPAAGLFTIEVEKENVTAVSAAAVYNKTVQIHSDDGNDAVLNALKSTYTPVTATIKDADERIVGTVEIIADYIQSVVKKDETTYTASVVIPANAEVISDSYNVAMPAGGITLSFDFSVEVMIITWPATSGSVETIEPVANGTSKEDVIASFGKAIITDGENATSADVVGWESADYDGSKAGEYIFTGKVLTGVYGSAVVSADIPITTKVTVLPAREFINIGVPQYGASATFRSWGYTPYYIFSNTGYEADKVLDKNPSTMGFGAQIYNNGNNHYSNNLLLVDLGREREVEEVKLIFPTEEQIAEAKVAVGSNMTNIMNQSAVIFLTNSVPVPGELSDVNYSGTGTVLYSGNKFSALTSVENTDSTRYRYLGIFVPYSCGLALADVEIYTDSESVADFCTYKFVDENGTVLKEETVEGGTIIEKPTNPTKKNTAQYTYTFAGWEGYTDGMTVTENVTFTAKFNKTVNQYTYKFLDEDGTTVAEKTVDYGTVIEKPANPTKANTAQYTYTFAGWEGYTDGMPVTENVTFTAKYNKTVNQYTYKFLDEDGTTITEKTVDYGTVIEKPTNPTKVNTAQYTYTFAGWEGYTESMAVTENVTFTAKFDKTVNQYTYKFLDEDGTTVAEKTVDYGTVIEKPANLADKDPYTFDYWKDYSDGMVITGNVSFTAVYKYKAYNIRVDGYEDITATAVFNSNYTIATAEKNGYIFMGYYTETDGKGAKLTDKEGNSIAVYDYAKDVTVYPYFVNSALLTEISRITKGYSFNITMVDELIKEYENGIVVIALYNEYRGLVAIKQVSVTEADVSITEDVETAEDVSYAKVMLWNKEDFLTPLCRETMVTFD